jgi:hypothetical protein
MFNVSVPPPQPNIPAQSVGTQQSAAARNPLSVLSGNIPNNVPTLEEEMAEMAHRPSQASKEAAFGR